MNARYDAPAEAEEAAYLEEFELGLVAEDDDRQDTPSPWIARACVAGALAAHIGLVSIVLGTGFGWSFPQRSVDFARVVDVEIEPRLPRMERLAVRGAPKDEAAGIPAQDRLALQPEAAGVPTPDRLALQSDAPEEAPRVPVRDRLALQSAAAAGEAETLETIVASRNAQTDTGAGALPVLAGKPVDATASSAPIASAPAVSASGAPLRVAQGAEAPAAPAPSAPSLSLAPGPDLSAKPDLRELAEAQDRPAIVASEAADESVAVQVALEPAQEPAVAQAKSRKVEKTVVAQSEPADAEGSAVVRAERGKPEKTLIAQTETDEAEGESEQGSAEDAEVQAAEARRAAARKAANERARREAAAAAARKRNEEARRREAEKRKLAAKKKSQASARSNKQGAARRYAGMVRARVAARKPGLKGPSSVSVAYAVAPNGSLRYAKIAGANNSGFFMNQSSLAAVRSAAPFPPPPAGMTPGQLSFTVRYTYR